MPQRNSCHFLTPKHTPIILINQDSIFDSSYIHWIVHRQTAPKISELQKMPFLPYFIVMYINPLCPDKEY
jgi:hypothetical protein